VRDTAIYPIRSAVHGVQYKQKLNTT